MRVVFIQDVPGVAQVGDIKNVANGHARNFLFPKNFAVPATPEEIKRIEKKRQVAAKQRNELLEQMQASAQALQDATLVFSKRVGTKGNIYGSVSTIAISQELKRLGYTVEKSMIKLEEPLRQLGTHSVEVELDKSAIATIKVIIEETKEETAEETSQESPAEESEAS